MTLYQPDVETLAISRESLEEITANHVEVIETVIASLDQDGSAMVSRTNEGHLWKFKYGSVEVMVQLTGSNDEDTLTVWAPVLTLPAKNEPQLLRQLMEMNWAATFEARFGILNDTVIVVSSRTLAGITPGEISRIMTVVATIADENDDVLQTEYGQSG